MDLSWFVFGVFVLNTVFPAPLVKIEVELLDDPVTNPEENEGFFEGDIDLGQENRNAVLNKTAHWPNGIVPYEISSSYASNVTDIILQAMREIETDTEVHGKTCVKFVPKTSKHHDFISIVPVAGCHSPIGHHPGKGILTIGPGCERKALIMHELIHTLGFWHEQTRHDRDKYISINITNVVADQQENFDLRNTQESTTYGIEYNFGSIMHYGPYAFAIDKSIPTIIPKVVLNGIMGQRLGLAKSDVAMIQNYYNCGSDLSHIATLDLKTLVDCDFEHGITSGKCILKQLNDDQFDWTLKSGATGISGSGPTADYTTGAGNYLLADARHHHNQTTRIQTIQLPRGVNCIQFFYFVYGSQVKSFAIKAKASGMDDHVIRQWDGSQLNEWKIQRLNMDSPVPWFLVIEAEIGNGDQSMVAIDELKIYHGHCILY